MTLSWLVNTYRVTQWFHAKALPQPSPKPGHIPICHLPPWFLRPVGTTHDEEAIEEDDGAGKTIDIRELPDNIASVGHLYFNPASRNGNAALTADPSVFMADTPNAPVVTADGPNSKREVPHLVFAAFILNEQGNDVDVGAQGNGAVAVRLYTMACDNNSRRFPMTSHFKDREQFEGVEILDWGIVNFDNRFQPPGASLPQVYAKVYQTLLERLEDYLD